MTLKNTDFITWDEWLKYTKHCQDIIQHEKEINDNKSKKSRMSYVDMCETYLPSFEKWKEIYDEK